jgi:hypothetical protein
MKLDKALALARRGKEAPPPPWWKRPIKRVADLRSRPSESRLPDPRAAASSPWAWGAAGVGATTAGVVAVVRRRRRASGETDASETPGDPTDRPSQNPGTVADSSGSSAAAEEGSGASRPRDA